MLLLLLVLLLLVLLLLLRGGAVRGGRVLLRARSRGGGVIVGVHRVAVWSASHGEGRNVGPAGHLSRVLRLRRSAVVHLAVGIVHVARGHHAGVRGVSGVAVIARATVARRHRLAEGGRVSWDGRAIAVAAHSPGGVRAGGHRLLRRRVRRVVGKHGVGVEGARGAHHVNGVGEGRRVGGRHARGVMRMWMRVWVRAGVRGPHRLRRRRPFSRPTTANTGRHELATATRRLPCPATARVAWPLVNRGANAAARGQLSILAPRLARAAGTAAHRETVATVAAASGAVTDRCTVLPDYFPRHRHLRRQLAPLASLQRQVIAVTPLAR
mmetsp:Transcript_35935/g.64203  ORF Transcript_35935/g.64203 Transcript_35935/m.64203 type:complete len:325 (+) Transcript_35935:207-1181(+)